MAVAEMKFEKILYCVCRDNAAKTQKGETNKQ